MSQRIKKKEKPTAFVLSNCSGKRKEKEKFLFLLQDSQLRTVLTFNFLTMILSELIKLSSKIKKRRKKKLY